MDLTNARHVAIECSKGHGGLWHWVAHIDGRVVGTGTARDPDEAVDAAEGHMWPKREAEEHNRKAPKAPEPGELPGNEAPAPGAVPTAKQVWDHEAKKRADDKSTLEKL